MKKPLKIFGIKIKDKDKLMESQSGGAFTALAEYFLGIGGVVYGCGQDSNNDAVYLRIDTIDNLWKIKGSKYVQAKIGSTYQDIEKDLKNGKIVLFSGTPCYVQAIKQYVNRLKKADNLYTVDLICHGVPSPKVYHSYLDYLEKSENAKIDKFIFRDKNINGGGWHKHVEKIIFENGKTIYSEDFTQLFYTNLPLRPSCGDCQFSNMYRVGDFTVGDYWGVQDMYPDFHDNRGVSLLFLNSERSMAIFKKIQCNVDFIETTEEKATLQHNLKQSSIIPRQSKNFWKDFQKNGIGYCIKHWSPIGGYSFRIRRKILKILKMW